MIKLILAFVLIVAADSLPAQDRNSIWIFGDSAGIDFNSTAMPITSGMDSRGSSTSICDSIGNLLFYACTKGNNWNVAGRVYNRSHVLMQNGDSIYGEAWHNELTIITNPGKSNQYLLFSMGEVLSTPGFYYSTIDMNQNGGLGAVTQKNIQLNGFRNADCVTAIKHGNGRDWWLFSKYSDNSTFSNVFYIYLVTLDSIYTPIILQFNNAIDGDNQKIIFNSTADALIQINANGFMCEYDFDRCTGIISNPNIIFPQQTSNFSRFFWNGAYSTDGLKFYISTARSSTQDTSYLLQYDLTSANIPASCDTLGFVVEPVQGGTVRLAPDGKIYYSCFYDWGFPGYPYPDTVYNQYNMNLGVINYPDSLGSACDYQPFSFYLGGKRTYYGLPNNPNYELGPVVGSICDTVHTGVEQIETNVTRLILGPNPANKIIYMNASGLNGKKGKIKVFDAMGKMIFSNEQFIFNSGYAWLEIDVSLYASGLYIVHLETEKEMLSGKFVKN